jgi:hypothetical protein
LIGLVPVFIESTGIARVSMKAVTAITETTGRRITAAVQRSQKVARSGAVEPRRRSLRIGWRKAEITRQVTPPASTRWPSRRIRTGSSVEATSTATTTTTIAPRAMERSAWLSIIQRPAREMKTAMPEKATARPEVESAVARASRADAPALTSSRKRARMNRE